MKKIATLYFAIFTALTLSAQWSTVYTGGGKVFDDADFPTAQDGFVLGHYSNGSRFMLKTTDGGVSWMESGLPTGFFNQIAMYSATSGYISTGGTPGILVYTNDGFASTVSHSLDMSFETMGLDILSDSSGFFMNNSSRFRSFDQYGATFSPVMDTLTGTGMFCVADPLTVYVSNGVQLVKSIDAGASWFSVNDGLPDYIDQGIVFANSDTGYYIGASYGIWRTMDGGLSFQNVINYPGTWIDANGSCCASISGWNSIRWSSDYGQTWATEFLGMPYSSGVYIAPGGDCYVVSSMTGEIRKRQVALDVDVTSFAQLSVFPNPANDVITISLAGETIDADARFTLVNTLGETVMEIQVPRDGRISLTGLAAGMYSYQVWSDGVMLGTGVTLKGF
ncbi:MAG TPA: T9SS type A sorting domain-containing protein [Bacteroidia bacterium]|nr:T9SS type A sorting domain-containing protein [Bacteroidia bacterium]